ncbi:MAG: hypothetical protein QOJ35_4148 [Solirubrobacteraceae bacterium]|nr:hypothetical protein [Solirubrobacteraceae bacterium]
MAFGDGFYRKARAKIEARIGEPVELIGWASRSGATGAVLAGVALRGAETAIGSGGVSGVAAPGGRMRGAGGSEGARLPMNFMVVLTPRPLRVFAIRKTWSGVKIKRELGSLPRAGLRSQIADGAVTKRFGFDGADGSALGFEMTRSTFASTFADELRAALG